MAFAESDLLKVAKLARITLKDEEMPRLVLDLDRIIAFVTKLSEVDVTHVEPMSHAREQALFMREDEYSSVLGRDCLRESVGYEDGLIRVPKIID